MKLTKYMSIALAAVTFTACSNDEDILNEAYSLVNISASVDTPLNSRSNPLGSVEEQKEFSTGDLISVTAASQNPVTYKYTGAAAWEAQNGGKLLWTANNMDFTAYFPARDGVSATNFTLPTDQSTREKVASADYMTCTANGVAKAETVSLAFKRQTALVTVKISSFKNQFDGTPTVTNLTVQSLDAVSTPAAKTYATITPLKEGKGVANTTYKALVAPTAGKEGQKFINLSVSYGSSQEQTLTVTGIPELQAGKSYTFNLSVGKDKVTVESVTVNDWGNSQDLEGGEATEDVIL